MMFGKKKKDNYDKIVVSHLVFLTKDQRYALVYGDVVESLGVLTQYKIMGGKYDVKHDEVICKYVIGIELDDDFVEVFPSHYKINLPYETKSIKNMNTELGFKDYHEESQDLDITALLDRKDGGKGELFFEAIYTSKKEKKQGFHKIQIADIKSFNTSMAFTTF